MFITSTLRVQLLHVLSRQIDSYRNSDGDRRTRENVVSSWMAPITITRLEDREVVISLVCSEPGCNHQQQEVRVKSIREVLATRLRKVIVSIIFFTIIFFILGGLGIGQLLPRGVIILIATLVYIIGTFTYQGVDLITPREGLGHSIEVIKKP